MPVLLVDGSTALAIDSEFTCALEPYNGDSILKTATLATPILLIDPDTALLMDGNSAVLISGGLSSPDELPLMYALGHPDDHTAKQVHIKAVSAVIAIGFDFSKVLRPGERLVSGIQIGLKGSTDLDLSNVNLNASPIEVYDEPVEAANAVFFHVGGGVVDTEYRLVVQGTTDSIPPQTVIGHAILRVIHD